MKNIDYKYVEEFVNSILEQLKNILDVDTVNFVQHYLNHDEYEMAFEGLFIEIKKLDKMPKIDFSKSKEIAEILKLDQDSVFDFEFWKKFNDYLEKKHGNR